MISVDSESLWVLYPKAVVRNYRHEDKRYSRGILLSTVFIIERVSDGQLD